MRAELAQLCPVTGETEVNAERVAAVVAESDADLVVFPELFLSGYRLQGLRDLAVPLDGPVVEGLRAAARDAERALIVGIIEADGERVFNSALCIDRDGTIAGSHRKTHPFGRERDVFETGDALEPMALAGRTIGVMVCFEVEIGEVARSLARRGAELLVTISANMEPYGPDHELFARARALENNLPHLYVNRVGEDAGLRFTGESRVIDAVGDVVAVAPPGEARLVQAVPAGGPRDVHSDYLAQLRPEIYG